MSIFLGVLLFLVVIGSISFPFIQGMVNDWNGWVVAGSCSGVILFWAAIFGYVQDEYPCPTITLQAKDWECKSTFEQRHFTGKVWVTETVCADYARKEQP